MLKQFLPDLIKPTKHNRRLAGLTTVELLMAIGVTALILGVALGLTLSSRRLYDADHTRVQTLQNLRGNLDLISIDIRKAGANLPSTFPALLVADGGSGADTLTTREGLIDRINILTICVQNTLIIYDANQANTNTNCDFVDQNPQDGLPDPSDPLYTTWQNLRTANKNNTLRAFIFSSTNNQGEFFNISNELDLGNGQFGLDGVTTNGYPQGARIFIIEERQYQLAADVLEMVVNEENTFNVSFGITDLQLQVGLQNGSTTNSFGANDNWKTIDWVDVTLTGQNSNGEGSVRTVSSRILPRNVISGN